MTKIFKIVAILEAISFLILLGVGMPMKYLYGDDSVVKMTGMPHGVLFVAYIILAFMIKSEKEWSAYKFLKICFLSLVPAGPFFIKHE